MQFGVDKLEGLLVESGWLEFRSTFRAAPTKAVKNAPFPEVGGHQVRQNLASTKAQVRATVGDAAVPAQVTQDNVITKTKAPVLTPLPS